MALAENSPRTIRLVTALVLLGMFVAGVVTGASLWRWLGGPPQHTRLHGPGGLPGPFGDLMLSKDEESKVHDVMEKHRPELEAALKDTFAKVRTIHEATEIEVRALLSPEQQKRFDEIKARRPPEPVPGMMPPGPGGGPGGLRFPGPLPPPPHEFR
jgi:hypothetical protein